MSPESKKIIFDHLALRQLLPQEQEQEQEQVHKQAAGMQAWLFQLAQGVPAQLIGVEVGPQDITAVLMTSLAITPHHEIAVMASAIGTVLAPVECIYLTDQLLLRVVVRGGRTSIPNLLDEGLVLLRHVAETVCVPAVRCASGELTFQQAMEAAIAALQAPPAAEAHTVLRP